MATQAQCAYCFEVLEASFDRRTPLNLSQIEELWDQFLEADDREVTTAGTSTSNPKPAAITKLLSHDSDPSATSSSSSLPSASSSSVASAADTPASSATSLSSTSRSLGKREKYPLFVTWNTLSRSGHKSLRGCIGTFEALELEHGLQSYALTSALQDHRFSPITRSLLPSLSSHVTLLTDFSQPTTDPLDWTVGLHGIRISFTYHSRRYGSTYLPDVAKEQGWTKEEALISLMKKAGWSGSSGSWQKVWRDGKGELIRYEGKQVGLEYAEYREWRDWVAQLDE